MDAVRRFADLVRRPDPPLDLAAFALAAGADPRIDTGRWLAELDRLATGVRGLDGLMHRLFVEERFAGNSLDYYDPRNSLLPEVLTRRLGIPIALAVVCIEVGRRAGVAMEGVGMPGHFLVRATGTGHLFDVYAGGAWLDLPACEARFRAATGSGPEVPFGPHLLATTPTTAILSRMLENLRRIYRRDRRPADLEWVIRMRLALPLADAVDLEELAEVLGDQGRWLDGARLLEAHLDEVVPAHAERLRTAARSLRAHLN